jgi:CRP/FNR family transcriptional regulator, cyclic AMP receptor protein
MKSRTDSRFDLHAFLGTTGPGKRTVEYRKNQTIFSQGNRGAAVFYVQKGRVKLAATSKSGKEAVVAILAAGDFLGEGCVAGQPLRMATAKAMEPTSLLEIRKEHIIRVLHEQNEFSDHFIARILARNIRFEADLVDQLFNSSEKRLARALLLLARYGKEGKPEEIVPRISQEVLAEMVGTTRSRVSYFMNKFRKLGFIKYNGGLSIHSSLLNVVLHE